MKIALDRSSPRFWMLYFGGQFSLLLIVLVLVRLLWTRVIHGSNIFDFAELAFESLVYSIIITVVKFTRYYIGKKRYEKNPVDRRKNNFFRE